MKYQVLARRYRPRRFEEVVGQESVGETLRGAILQDRIAHAYLFTGPRGVGKTSMARIFAKALNCPRAVDRTGDKELWAQPCDSCSTCEAIHTGQDIDVVELDGASHRGIEDVRSIIEGVNRPATRSVFKVYIIDEVHMLTREAFNALLKTLEEPPAHVKFIFATTEPHRIPETVLSRCQRFDFHPIGEEAIVRRLSQILVSEGRSAAEGLLERIARCGKGGLRDAQTLLDQLMTFSDGVLKIEDLERVTGRVPENTVSDLAGAVLNGEPETVLAKVGECFERGADAAILLEQVIDNFRGRIHAMVREGGAKDVREGARLSAGPAFDRLIGSLQMLLDASSKLKFSPFVEVSVEVVLLKLSRLEDPAALEDVLRALSEAEGRGLKSPASVVSASPAPSAPSSPAAPPVSKTLRATVPSGPVQAELLNEGSSMALPQSRRAAIPSAALPLEPSPAASAEPDFRHLLSVWDQIRVELDLKHPDIAPYFKDLTPSPLPGFPGTFLLEFRNEFYYRQMKSGRKQDALLEVVREVSRASWKLRMDQGGNGQDSPAPGIPLGGSLKSPAASATPSARSGRPPSTSREALAPPAKPGQDGISKSPIVKKSLDLFNGRLV